MRRQLLLWSLSAVSISTATLADEGGGLFADSRLGLLNRNYYYNNDNHSGGQDGREWGHALLWQFNSGYTQGTVGAGVDAHLYNLFKFDSGRGRNHTQMLVPNGSGRQDTSSSAGGALKFRASETEVKYGDLRPYNPVFAIADPRLMPATAKGIELTSRDIERLYLEAGHFTSAKDYNRTHRDGGFYAAYARVEGGDVTYLGGQYEVNEKLKLGVYASKYTNLWRQQYLSLSHTIPLAEAQAILIDLNYYRSRNQGRALLGEIDIDAGSVALGYRRGIHTLSLGYQKIVGDEPLDYLGLSGGGYQDSIFLGNASQYADFNGPNEHSWRLQYDATLAPLGLPSARLSIRHVRGSGIDGSKTAPDSAYFGWYGSNEKHNTTDLDVSYVVESGFAKNLKARVRHAHHRMTSGYSDADVDRFRIVLEYPWSIL
ncbi:OprD family outer membrane porin [Pseudomonas aeruginosa]